MTIAHHDTWPTAVRRWDTLVTGLRVAMGLVFLIAGLKVIYPPLVGLADHNELVEKFTDPTTGFIAPWLAERITDFGISLDTFLLVKGIGDTLLGLLLILGLATRMNAAMVALFLWTFTVAAPEAGAIRLSRDLALLALCVALVRTGGGRWSLDRRIARSSYCSGPGAGTGRAQRRLVSLMFRREALPAGNRTSALLVIRLGLALPLLASALFTGGPGGIFNNPVNSTLPPLLLFALGAALVIGLAPRWVLAGLAPALVWIIAEGLGRDWFYVGLDNIKRELGLLAAAVLYTVAGPDRWSRPRPARLRCAEVSKLLMSYVDGSLDQRQRDTLEAHFSDCPECWRYLASYTETVGLGRQLREDTIPEPVYERLRATLAATLSDGHNDGHNDGHDGGHDDGGGHNDGGSDSRSNDVRAR